MITVYVAGPVSGRPNQNREAFERARRDIEINPLVKAIVPFDVYRPSMMAERCPALEWCQAMLACLPVVEIVDYVYLLAGWRGSRGACVEAAAAKAKGKRCLYEEAS